MLLRSLLLSNCLSVYLYIYLSVWLPVCLPACLIKLICLSACLSACLSIYLTVRSSICLHLYLPVGLPVTLPLGICTIIQLEDQRDNINKVFHHIVYAYTHRNSKALSFREFNLTVESDTLWEWCISNYSVFRRRTSLIHILNPSSLSLLGGGGGRLPCSSGRILACVLFFLLFASAYLCLSYLYLVYVYVSGCV